MIDFDKYSSRLYRLQQKYPKDKPIPPNILLVPVKALSPEGLLAVIEAQKQYDLEMKEYEESLSQKYDSLDALKQDFKKEVFDDLGWHDLGPIADLIFQKEWEEEMSSFMSIYCRCKDSVIIKLIRSHYFVKNKKKKRK